MILRALKRQPMHGSALAQHINRTSDVRIYRATLAGAKHLEEQVSSFERMLEGITRVLAPVKP